VQPLNVPGNKHASHGLRILAVSNYYPPHHGGGYGLQMSWFCEGLAERGHRLHVVTSSPEGNIRGLKKNRVTVDRPLSALRHAVSARHLFTRTLANRKAVRRAIRSVGPDLIFCGGMDDVGFNTYAALLKSGIPTLTWLGDTWLGQAWRDLRRYDAWADFAAGGRRRGLGGIAKRALGAYGRLRGLYDGPRPNQFEPVAALSEFVLNDLRASGAPVPPEVPIIPICLHAAFSKSNEEVIGHSGSRERRLRALFVSRMERPKGPDVAIRALAAAVALGADVRLTFAGLRIEQLQAELELEAKALSVTDRIVWAGTPPLAELVELYRTHDVFLFPSRIVEGLGVVNCEALACGLPIIGTAHSGSAEVIVPGETGFRVKKNDADAIGRHLAELHADRNLLERLSASATQFAGKFLPTPIMDRLEQELMRVASP
jgi:glycogen synthase